MHQISFGGRALPGPDGGAYSTPPAPRDLHWNSSCLRRSETAFQFFFPIQTLVYINLKMTLRQWVHPTAKILATLVYKKLCCLLEVTCFSLLFTTGSMVVLTCCKGDCQSQWKMPIFAPSQLGNPLMDFDKIWNMITSATRPLMPNLGSASSNMLSKFSREPRELPWQPNLRKNKPKLAQNVMPRSHCSWQQRRWWLVRCASVNSSANLGTD